MPTSTSPTEASRAVASLTAGALKRSRSTSRARSGRTSSSRSSYSVRRYISVLSIKPVTGCPVTTPRPTRQRSGAGRSPPSYPICSSVFAGGPRPRSLSSFSWPISSRSSAGAAPREDSPSRLLRSAGAEVGAEAPVHALRIPGGEAPRSVVLLAHLHRDGGPRGARPLIEGVRGVGDDVDRAGARAEVGD